MALIMERRGIARNARRVRRAGLAALLAVMAAGCAQDRGAGPIAQRPADAAPAPAATGAAARVDLTAPVRVALLAPLSARDPAAAAEARGIADGARLAARERPGLIALDVRDTAGTRSGAAAAAAGVAAQGGAALILGPLYGDNAGPAADAARGRGVNVISFSNTPSAAGGGVWVSGLLARSEADRILGHAAGQGLAAIGMFRPDSAAGEVALEAAMDAARGLGVRIGPVVAYPRSFEGIQDAAPGYADAHRATGAQAVLLPDQGQGLQTAASFLNYHGISRRETQFLGLASWQSPATLAENALRGGRFAAPDPERMASFAVRYEAEHGRAPTALAWLGYDAAVAAAEMVRRARARGDATPFEAADITDPGGFEGATGPFRFTRDGLNRRALAVVEVGADGFRTVEPAPVALGGPGA